jgi:hypothetical protein|tara:strand:- start:3085 stop:4290 length:1206 start_codon:yes stop_codon:yes gene_type:complete
MALSETALNLDLVDPLYAHSPLGASGASRWMKCAASYRLSEGAEDSGSEHAKLGTAAHSLGEACLNSKQEAWTFIGQDMDGCPVDKNMADAVQVYLDALAEAHPDRDQNNFFVERKFHCPTIHPLFYGTSDATYLDEDNKHLHVWDYKHGAGIVVEAEENPQLMYYACGVLEEFELWEDITDVTIYVAQPRGFHWKGPVRSWHTTADSLASWLEDELSPSMDWAVTSDHIESGEHCRFCPARMGVCPQLKADMTELEELIMAVASDDGAMEKWSNEDLARFLDLHEMSKIVHKAAGEMAFGKLQSGKEIPGWKLVPARANREWKEGAEIEAKKKFEAKAFSAPAFLSPAKVEKLPGGTAFAQRWAFKPDAGLTVAKQSDARRTVSQDTKSMFKPTTAKGLK